MQRLLTPARTRFWEVQWLHKLRYNISPVVSVNGVTAKKSPRLTPTAAASSACPANEPTVEVKSPACSSSSDEIQNALE